MNGGLLLLGGALVLTMFSKPTGTPRQGGGYADQGPPWRGLPAGGRPDTIMLDGRQLTPGQLEVFDGLLRAFREVGGLTQSQQLALLAFAWHESRYNPRAEGRVDAQWGNSYTVFQLRRDVELAQAMQALGLSFSQVVPTASVGGAALYPYLKNQVRVATWLAGVKGFPAIWARNSDPEKAFVMAAFGWAGIRVSTWAELLANAIAGPVFSRLGRLPTNAEVPAVNAELRSRGSQVMGTLDRLVTYRDLRRQLGQLGQPGVAGLVGLMGPPPGWRAVSATPVGYVSRPSARLGAEVFVGPRPRRILGARERETRSALLQVV